MVFVKGAVERVLSLCKIAPDESSQKGERIKEEIMAVAEKMAQNGLRVLAFAQERTPGVQKCCLAKDLEHTLSFLGLVAMRDPPRGALWVLVVDGDPDARHGVHAHHQQPATSLVGATQTE